MKAILNILFILFAVVFAYSQESPEKIFENVDGAVVIIQTYDLQNTKAGLGSGVILNDLGIIVTAFHVIAGSEKIEVKKNDIVIAHEGIIGINVEKDIAILKITDKLYPNIPLAKSNDLKVGQRVYAIGSPMGLENSISDGIISGFREFGVDKQKFIQITASLSSGSSGGAILNANGELIGISTMKLIGGENLNFAVTTEDILSVNSGQTLSDKQIKGLMDFFKGYDAYENNRYDEAVKYYDKFIEVYPDEAKGYNHRGLALRKMKKFQKALNDFDASIRIDKSNAIAFMNRGETYYELEKYTNAIRDFTEVIRLEPENYDAYYARGLSYMSDEDWGKAIKDFSFVIKTDKNYVNAYVNRGLCYYNTEDYEYCMNDWQRAMYLDPGLVNKLRPLINIIDQIDKSR